MINLGNVMILGDSYSTFRGFIPEGYDFWYSEKAKPETDVTNVNQTWWYPLISETGSNLVLNSSYSGTTICHTGYSGTNCINISFCGRFDRRINEGFFDNNNIDTLFIFGGTNDSWADSPIGELMLSDWDTEDVYKVLPSIGYLLCRAKTMLPDTRIIAVLNSGLKEEIGEGFSAACEHFGIELIKLGDIDKREKHPTVLGMKQIREQILNYLNSKNS